LLSIVSSADRKLREFQSKSRIELAAIVFATTGKTSYRATHAADSRKLLTAIRTAIDEPRGVRSHRKREVVAPLLVGESQFETGLPPLVTVWQNPPSSRTKLGENMRQFMAQSSIDFGRMLD